MPCEARHSQANRRVTGMRSTSMGEHLYLADQKKAAFQTFPTPPHPSEKTKNLILHNRYIVLLVRDVLMRVLTNNNAPVLTLIPAWL